MAPKFDTDRLNVAMVKDCSTTNVQMCSRPHNATPRCRAVTAR
jgi:hypothetical protein